MNEYDANPHKEGGYDADPCRIELRTGETVDAVHHFIDKNGWVAVYDTHRSHGIAQKIPPSNVAKIELRNPAREEREIGDGYECGTNEKTMQLASTPPEFDDEVAR